jgi:hypothetical protein
MGSQTLAVTTRAAWEALRRKELLEQGVGEAEVARIFQARVALVEHSSVVLTEPLPELGLEVGAPGTIVHSYADGHAYEAEFFGKDEATIGVATVHAEALWPVESGWNVLRRVTKPMTDAEAARITQERYPGAIEHADLGSEDLARIDHMIKRVEAKGTRRVPVLTPGQIAFHSGLTAHREAFSLEAAKRRYSNTDNPGPSDEQD